jgi:hypothetical protein
MWSRWGLILSISSAEPANPGHGVQTLLKRREAAIRTAPTAEVAAAIVSAPRIILGFSAISKADDTDADTHHK